VFDTLTCEGRAGGTVCCVWEDEKGKGDITIQIWREHMENCGDEERHRIGIQWYYDTIGKQSIGISSHS